MKHVEIANPWWQGKRSRHSRRMGNPKFCISGKRPTAANILYLKDASDFDDYNNGIQYTSQADIIDAVIRMVIHLIQWDLKCIEYSDIHCELTERNKNHNQIIDTVFNHGFSVM